MIMKITQVISDSNVGGAGILLASVVGELMNEFDFEIIVPQGSRLCERLPRGVRISELHFRADKSFCPNDISTFHSHLRRSKPNILHTHAALSARIGARLAGVHTCLSTRHCAKEDAKVKKMTRLQRTIYNYCTDITISTADFATRNLICEGVDESKIVTIKNGSAPTCHIDNQQKQQLLSSLGLCGEDIIIGSCARLEDIKGQDIILRAAPMILNEFPRAKFLFLGCGSRMNEYLRLCAAMGIERNVIFCGYVSDPAPYQNLFYINVNSSRGTETSCLATSECMALGIPTVASDFGGNTEMVKDGVCGLIFPSGNSFALAEAVMRLLRDKELYKRLSQGAKDAFERSYSRVAMVDCYRGLYRALGRFI